MRRYDERWAGCLARCSKRGEAGGYQPASASSARAGVMPGSSVIPSVRPEASGCRARVQVALQVASEGSCASSNVASLCK